LREVDIVFLESILIFLPSFLGVLSAFFIQRLWQKIQNSKDRYQLLKDLRAEVEKCSKLLVGEGNLCPIDMWKSGIATGFLKLIPFVIKEELASIYFRLECHNYEAEKVREVSLMATMEKGKPQNILKMEPVMKNSPAIFKTYAEILHWQLSIKLINAEKKLHNDIECLLKGPIWN
jgi:hypothetical protein